MSLFGEIISSARPQFIVGFFIGICLSSAFLQVILLTLGLQGFGEHLTSDNSPTAPGQPLNRNRDLLSESLADYEVHNLGLKLHSADQEAKTQGDSHVIKYFEEEQFPPMMHFDSLISGSPEQLAEKAGHGLVYTGVLTDRFRLADQAAVVRMTWGSELPTVQFFFDTGDETAGRTRREHMREIVGLPDISSKETFTPKHTAEALRHICSHHHDNYHWYVLLRDATYVHTSGLLRILDRLSPTEDLIIGQMESAHDGVCSASPGIIISSRALSRICPRIDKCVTRTNIEQCLGIQCISSKKISPEFHVTSGKGDLDVGQLVGAAERLPHLSDQSVFIGTLPISTDFYRLHLHFTRVKISKTQEEIQRLGEELTRTRRSVRPKRDKSLLRVQETAIFGSDALLNKTSEPFFQYIDNSGNLYLETCKVRKQDVGKEDSSPYRTALELAKKSIDKNAEGLDFFSYKVTKPNLGVEYQFFFIQTLTHNPSLGHRQKPPREKVHQVTILHPYDKLEMESKEIQSIRTINFVIPTTGSAEQINTLLHNYEQVCLGQNLDRCNILIVIFRESRAPNGRLNSADVQRMLLPFQEHHPGMKSQVMEVQGETLTLARTLQMVDSAYERDDLLAFVPPDVGFTEDFLYRCQFNSLPMKRAYFPVIFQRYNNHHSKSISEGTVTPPPLGMDKLKEGYWANSDFSTFCAYNEDIQMFDNLPSSSHDLHNMFKASENMGVFRAPDPGLSRDWRAHVCSMSNSIDRNNCVQELKYMNMQ